MDISKKRWKSILFQNQKTLLENLEISFLKIQRNLYELDWNSNEIYVHFLRTSILNNLPLFRLEISNEFFTQTYFQYWEMPFLLYILEENIPLKCTPSSPDRKIELVMEKKRIKEVEKIQEAFYETIPIWISSLKKITAKEHIFLYGEYMGPYQKIYLKGENFSNTKTISKS